MRLKIFQKIAPLFVVLFAATNCSDDLKKLNVDPTATSAESFNPNYMLSPAQLRYTGSIDFSYETWRAELIYFSTMMQHFATTIPYWAGDKYTVNTGYNWAYFEKSYAEQVQFIVDAMSLAKDKPQYANCYQICRIWKVVIFHRITDIYGDVPYFDAGKGYYNVNFTPTYDAQADIYADMLKELKEAAEALDATKEVASGDMIYNGDVAKWKKFAYSMMLRLGMRLTKIDNANAQKWVEAAAAGGVMQSVSDDAFLIHDPTGGRPTVNRISNVFNENGGERAQVKWSKTMIDFLQDNDDPRLGAIAELPPLTGGNTDYTFGTPGDNTTSSQIGMPNGYNVGAPVDIAGHPDYPGAVGSDALGNYSRPRSVLLKLNSPTIIQTYGEVELLLAEAAKRGWSVGGTATDHYNAGVRGAMKSLEKFDPSAAIADADIDSYLTANPYDDASGLEMINNQYWAATIFNDYESFANWRRSGFPTLTPVNHPNGGTGGVIPRRMEYPVAEASSNATNYKSAVERLGGNDTMLGRVWWDKQ